MTPEQARLFVDYIIGMPDQKGAAEYVRFSAFRLDDTFFEELRRMVGEAHTQSNKQREQSLDWLMAVASDGCHRAYLPFAAAKEVRQGSAKAEPQTDHSRAMELIQIDKRVTSMMMRQHFNPVDSAMVDDWNNIADGYRKLINAGPPKTPFYTIESVRLKFAQALSSLAGTYASLNDRKNASAYFAQAAKAFDEAGESAEAARCRSRPIEDKMVDEAEFDDQIRGALEDLDKLEKNQPEYFSRLVDLGEIQASAEDDFAAEKTLLRALCGLKAAKWSNPCGSDLAEALVSTLKGLDSGHGVSPLQNIQTSMSVRNLYRRIHLRLADIYRRLGDSGQADEQLKLAEAMDRSSPDDDFSTTMRNKLAGEWMTLFR